MSVVLDRNAFVPFSSGPRMCVGKALALTEMRMVASCLVQRFDIKPADGFLMDSWENNLEDYYVMGKGDLPVRLTRRY